MFTPEMLAAAQKMMDNMTPEQMSQIAGMASKMNPDMLKSLNGGNGGMPMPTASQFEEAKEKMKGMTSEDMKSMFSAASNKLAGQNMYMINGATQLKNEGNAKVRAGEYEAGIEIFQRALTNLESCPAPDESVEGLIQSIKLNMALCFLKLKEYEKCIDTCDSIIVKDGRSVKGLYRRGLAKRELGKIVEAAIDLKLSMLHAEQKDEIINEEYGKTLKLVLDPEELARIDATSITQEAATEEPVASNLAKAKEIIEANPDVVDRMGDVISQLDDTQLDGLLTMSAAAGNGMEGVVPDLGEMKKILKNKDFMKSMSEMMKNMDPSSLQGLMTGGPNRSTSSSLSPPDMSNIMKDPAMLKSMESMIDSIPDQVLEEMVGGTNGESPTLPAFLTGSRMKWLVRRIMGLIRLWIFVQRFIAVCWTRTGKIAIAVLVVCIGVYCQYGDILVSGKPKEHEKQKQVNNA